MSSQLLPSCPIGTPLRQRVLSKVIRIPESTCWHWGSAIDSDGYGLVKVGGKMQFAHRIAYELFIGKIPDGLHMDHLCRQRDCMNPHHLEPVTNAENHRRSSPFLIAKKTHCKHGHPMTGDGSEVKIEIKGHRVKRRCLPCARLDGQRLRAKRRAA